MNHLWIPGIPISPPDQKGVKCRLLLVNSVAMNGLGCAFTSGSLSRRHTATIQRGGHDNFEDGDVMFGRQTCVMVLVLSYVENRRFWVPGKSQAAFLLPCCKVAC